MIIYFNGRIDTVEFFEGHHYTTITTPAPDPYSAPSRYRFRSVNPVGAVGQTIDVQLQMKGSVRQETFRDKLTGQPKTWNKGSVYFEFIAMGIPADKKN